MGVERSEIRRRWWQSVLFNPEGFGAEFRQLNFPRSVFGILLAVGLAFFVTRSAGDGGSFVSDALVILVVLFAFQGLAVIHFRARVVKIANGWLVAMYALLMLMPQVVGPLLASAGVADTLGDFRRLRGPRNAA